MPIKKITMLSWNVNGLRAMLKKGFEQWMSESKADIICLQETKISSPGQLPHHIEHPDGYSVCWNCSTEKKVIAACQFLVKLNQKNGF